MRLNSQQWERRISVFPEISRVIRVKITRIAIPHIAEANSNMDSVLTEHVFSMPRAGHPHIHYRPGREAGAGTGGNVLRCPTETVTRSEYARAESGTV